MACYLARRTVLPRLPPPDPEDERELDQEDDRRGPEHRTERRRRRLRERVEVFPLGEAALVAALVGAAVPEREGARHDLRFGEGDAARDLERAPEDDRPFALVVGRGRCDVLALDRGDAGAAGAVVAPRRAGGEIDEPE